MNVDHPFPDLADHLSSGLVTLVLLPVQLLALRYDWRVRRTLPRYWHRVAAICSASASACMASSKPAVR